MKKFRELVVLLCLTGLLFVLGFYVQSLSPQAIKKDNLYKVFFLDWYTNEGSANLLSMDSDGQNMQFLISASGTTAWSKDGRFLATGCSDMTKVCVFEDENFTDWTVYPPKQIINPDYIEIPLPEECLLVQGATGVSSISWSADGKKMIIVCQNKEVSNACVVGIDGNYHCWGEKKGDDIYSRADWSPNDNLIVIDTGKGSYLMAGEGNGVKVVRTGRVMQIVDLDGKVITSLTDGWSPAWSPDGEQLAFFHWDDERGYPGIASIRKDGSDFRWIYRPPLRGSGGDIEYFKPFFQDVYYCSGSSKISWSPDKDFIIVEAMLISECSYSLFKIDIDTGTLVNLTTNLSRQYQEPSIQP